MRAQMSNPEPAAGIPQTSNRGRNETRKHSRRKELPSGSNDENRRRKDRSAAGKSDLQSRPAGLQHNEAGNAVRATERKRADRKGRADQAFPRQADPVLESRIEAAIKEVTEAYEKEQRIARRLRSWSYARRLSGFVEERVDPTHHGTVGMRHWYSELSTHLLFNYHALKLWFRGVEMCSGVAMEPVPCIMRGSRYAMREKFRVEGVLKRWVRRQKITCLELKEWVRIHDGLLFSTMRDELRERGYRDDRYGLLHLCNRESVLVNGESFFVDDERREELRKMHKLAIRLKKAA